MNKHMRKLRKLNESVTYVVLVHASVLIALNMFKKLWVWKASYKYCWSSRSGLFIWPFIAQTMPKYTNKIQGSHYFERTRMKRARPVFKSYYSIFFLKLERDNILYYLLKQSCIPFIQKIIQWFKRRGVTFEDQSGIFTISLTTCFPIGEGAWPLIWTTLIILQLR